MNPHPILRTILLDDDQGALETLKLTLQKYCPDVEILGYYTDVHIAIEAILASNPDLLLMDIEMPSLSGFDIVERIRGMAMPEVIFITAYNEYALKAFKYAAVDFLLKPVDALELKAAIARCQQKRLSQQSFVLLNVLLQNYQAQAEALPTLVLPTQEGYIFIKPNDIIRCEAQGSYTQFFLQNNEKIMVSRTMHSYEDILAEHNCFRVHDKHIVNLKHVKKFIKKDGGQVIMSDGSEVNVSRRRKEAFLLKMKN